MDYKGSEFYNRPMKSWLQKNDIEMHLMHNKGKFAIAERFFKTLTHSLRGQTVLRQEHIKFL